MGSGGGRLADDPQQSAMSVGVTVGYISRQHTIWCGTCVLWVQRDLATKTAMVRWAKKVGWRWSKHHGWLCPSCMRERSIKGRERR
jgi:hypothetical protein